jgi:hypothetical protein
MASRALIARLSTANSSWVGSAIAGHRALQLGFDLSRAAHRALQQVAHADDGLVEVERPRLEPLPARKRQQLIRQLGPALGGRAHVAEALREPTVDARRGHASFQESEVAEYDGQKIVEVMRHPRRQLADGFQPLHLAQRGLHAFALLDLIEELPVGGGKLGGAFLDPRFQFR